MRDLENLLEALSSGDARISAIAGAMLFSMGDAAVALVERALKEKPPAERQRIAQALGRIGSEHAIDLLTDLLDDSDWSVCVTAALELARRGDPAANETLMAAFEEVDPYVRGEIALALGATADMKATAFLARALHDDDPMVRTKVAQAMVRIARRESARSEIRGVIESASDLLLAQALKDSGQSAQSAAVAALAAIHGKRAIEMILKSLSSDLPGIRLAVIKALVVLKGELGPGVREEIQKGIIRALDDEAPQVRLKAIEALKAAYPRDQEAIRALVAVYKRDRDDRVREEAGMALGDHRPKALQEQPVFKLALAVLAVLILSCLIVAIGRRVYQPEDPLPASGSCLSEEEIYGPNAITTALSQAVLAVIAEKREAIGYLQPSPGEAFRIPCPRQVEDILFQKKDCEVQVLGAHSTNASLVLRFLVFRDVDQVRSVALGVSEPVEKSPDGEFIGLPEEVEGEHAEIIGALWHQVARMLDMLGPEDWVKYPPDRKGVYLPFVASPYDLQKAEDLRKSNFVIQHLLLLAANFNPELSLGARIFTVGQVGATGMYRPGYRAIQRSMFQKPAFDRTLAHELVHAVLDGVEDKDSLLKGILPYLASKHPQMLQVTLPTFYEKEITGPHSETIVAEEAIAFLAGSLAAKEKKVYFFVRPPLVTDMSDITWLNEPLLSGDVELLIRLGLVPQWMSPKTLGYSEDRITERYYEMVDRHSLSK